MTHIILLLLLSAFQLFFLFVMGQYVARIYDEVRNRPLYIVANKIGFAGQKPKLPAEKPPDESIEQPVPAAESEA